jgi:hypothetical protein
MYETFLLERLEWVDDRTFTAFFHGNLCCRFTVRPWGIPYLRPRLRLQLDRSLAPVEAGVGLPLEAPVIRKVANAFVPEAAPTRILPVAARSAIHRVMRRDGGLWVGGTLSVSSSGVSFMPNRVNRLAHGNPASVTLRAGDIREVRREFGWVTGIVVVGHAGGEFRFRCYGARQMAAAMATQFHLRQEPPAA